MCIYILFMVFLLHAVKFKIKCRIHVRLHGDLSRAVLPQYAVIASAAPNCTLSKGFTRSLRHLKLLAMLAIESSKGAIHQSIL